MTEIKKQQKRIYIPQMSQHAFAFAGVMRGLGIDAQVLPKTDDESVALGKANCRGRECLPCLLCTGDLLRKCNEPGFEANEALFFMPQTPGACRFGQYNVLQKQILEENGHPDVVLMSPSSADSFRLFGDDPRTLRKRAWQGLVAVDLLAKVLHENRPYEVVPGSADDLYQECLDSIVAAAEAGCGDRMIEVMEEIARRFSKLPIDRSEPRPLIGIIGEIYLMLNPQANGEIVRTIEKSGGEVIQGSFMEYLSYVDWKRKEKAVRFGMYRDFFKASANDAYQSIWARKLLDPLLPILHHPVGARMKELMRGVRKHYEPLLGTEAPLTMASAMDICHHGAAGIINVLPFSCMPGTIVKSMAPVLTKEELEDVPWLDIAFDGQQENNILVRLGAFIHQAQQFHRRVVLARKNGRTGKSDTPTDGDFPEVPPESRVSDGMSEPSAIESLSQQNPSAGGGEKHPVDSSVVDRSPLSDRSGIQFDDTVEPRFQFSRARISRGVGLFAILTAIGFGIVIAFTSGFGPTVEALSEMSLGLVGVAILLVGVEILIGAYRYQIFLQEIKPGTPYMLAVRAQLANRFAAAVTPSQTGGGPALLYIFSRGGIPVSQALSVLIVNFVATLVFFFTSMAVAGYVLRDAFSSETLTNLVWYAIIAFGAMTLISIIALMRPVFLRRMLRRINARLRKRNWGWRTRMARTLDGLMASVEKYHGTCMYFFRKKSALLGASFVLITIMYLIKFMIAYCLVLALGLNVSFWMVVAVQALIHAVLYLAPTPGAGGFAEVIIAVLMVLIIPEPLIAPFTIAFRFVLVLVPAVAGSFVLIGALRRAATEPAPIDQVLPEPDLIFDPAV